MALVITLILLAVITFLAITFLVISRRETGAVTTATDQTVARLAADAALQRAEAQALTTILANRNSQLFDLLVSTNYINRLGYNTAQPLGQVWPTNVNYEYNNVGTPLDASRFRQNMGNLLYDPRAPVFIRTNDNPNAPLHVGEGSYHDLIVSVLIRQVGQPLSIGRHLRDDLVCRGG